MTYRKQGGLHFWRIGRLGGSFYLARRATMPDDAGTAVTAMVASLAFIVAFMF